MYVQVCILSFSGEILENMQQRESDTVTYYWLSRWLRLQVDTAAGSVAFCCTSALPQQLFYNNVL